MSTANVRGEVSLTFGGTTRKLRPSFASIVDTEERTGLTFFQIAAKLSQQTLKLKDIATILHCGFKAAGDTIGLEEIGNFLLDEGVYAHYKEIADYVLNVCTAGKTEDESAKKSPGEEGLNPK